MDIAERRFYIKSCKEKISWARSKFVHYPKPIIARLEEILSDYERQRQARLPDEQLNTLSCDLALVSTILGASNERLAKAFFNAAEIYLASRIDDYLHSRNEVGGLIFPQKHKNGVLGLRLKKTAEGDESSVHLMQLFEIPDNAIGLWHTHPSDSASASTGDYYLQNGIRT